MQFSSPKLALSPSRVPLLLLLVGGLAGRGLLLLSSLPGVGSGSIVRLLLLGVPLASLENENSNQNESENGVASREDLQAVLAAEDELAVLALVRLAIEAIVGPDLAADASQSLDNVGNVDTEADEVENERGAVKEEVGLARSEELDEEAEEADRDDDVEDAADEGRRLVDKLQMRLEMIKEVVGDGGLGPEEREVVGEGSEKDAEEEADGWGTSQRGEDTRS